MKKITLKLSLLLVASACSGVMAEFAPVNPNATPRARAVLHYLYELTGKGMLVGVHGENWSPARMPENMYKETGKYMGYYDNDFRYGDNFDGRRKAGVAEVKKRYLEQKTIVGYMWHMTRPMDPQTMGFEQSVQGNITEAQLNAILKEGTPENVRWIARLDSVAEYLKELRDAGVPVLWRPYHEMNGAWFWWGKWGTRFKELWIQMYDRYVKHHNLNNLLWMWCPNCVTYGAGGLEEHYPGHEYVDVLGSDIYANKSYDWEQRFHDDLWKLGEGRPIAMGEVGDLPDPEFIKNNQPKWTMFLLWSGYEHQYANNATRNKYIFNHEFAITQDELPSWIFEATTAGLVRPNKDLSRNLMPTKSLFHTVDLHGRTFPVGNSEFVRNMNHGSSRTIIRILPDKAELIAGTK